MFVGHIGIGLALKRADPRRSVAWYVACALLLDLILWLLVLIGIEQVHIPDNYAQIHYLTFTFPYSHSLVASLLWSFLFFVLGAAIHNRQTGFLFAVAVFSHFLGDVIEHIPEIPIYDDAAPKLGFSLWEHIYVALALEIAILMWGLWLYTKATRPLPRRYARYGMITLAIFLAFLQVAGQLYAPPPPGVRQLASNSFISLTITMLLVYLLDKRRVHASSEI